jgi:hypothetical protein
VDPVPLSPLPPVHVPIPHPTIIEHPALPDYETWRHFQTINTYGDPIPPGLLNDDHLPTKHHVDDYDYQEDEDEEEDDSDNDRYSPEPPKKKKSRKPKRMENNKKRETPHQHPRTAPKKQKKFKPSTPADLHYNPQLTKDGKVNNFGFVKPVDEDTYSLQASSLNNQYFNVNPSAVDPSYYTTLPDDREMEHMTGLEDEIYSGLLTNKFPKQVNEKTAMIKNINSNRSKKHTKNLRTF